MFLHVPIPNLSAQGNLGNILNLKTMSLRMCASIEVFNILGYFWVDLQFLLQNMYQKFQGIKYASSMELVILNISQ